MFGILKNVVIGMRDLVADALEDEDEQTGVGVAGGDKNHSIAEIPVWFNWTTGRYDYGDDPYGAYDGTDPGDID